MRINLQTWNVVLLGTAILAIQYLNIPSTPIGNRAVAIGVLFYLVIPILVLLVVDGIKIHHYFQRKKALTK